MNSNLTWASPSTAESEMDISEWSICKSQFLMKIKNAKWFETRFWAFENRPRKRTKTHHYVLKSLDTMYMPLQPLHVSGTFSDWTCPWYDYILWRQHQLFHPTASDQPNISTMYERVKQRWDKQALLHNAINRALMYKVNASPNLYFIQMVEIESVLKTLSESIN